MSNNKTKLSTLALLSTAFFFASCSKENITTDAVNELANNNLKAGSVAVSNMVANQALVKFRSGTTEKAKNDVFAKISAKTVEYIFTKTMEFDGENEGLYLINFPIDVPQALEALQNNPFIEFAEPNYIYQHAATSSDPYFTNGSLWGMSNSTTFGTGANEAWTNNHTGSSSVVVAVIDEGIDNQHEDLASNCWNNPGETANDGIDNDKNGYIDDIYGWDFDGNNNSTFDGAGDDHATHVAGTIGGVANTVGVVGINWNVKMMSCKFLGATGGTTANAVKAVDYITALKNKGINIVASNNSWGGGGFSTALYAAISRANTAGVLFIAAAGNSGTNNDNTASFPGNYSISNKVSGKTYAALPNMIVVAAIASNGTKATFSQYGAKSVHLGAPGVNIFSSLPYNTYGSYNGTSMATPHVSGAAALYKANNPTASAATVKAAILNTVTKISSLTGKCTTGGCLNVRGF
ncbi:MAG: S8 family serine peptidase [Sphingobacteriales bacterium]|nr:S8 family serine peptidase [Sphingobacteriales bacterium]